jgi:serine/threonine protein kinase
MLEDLTGKVIRGYEFHELLGHGGCGVVYRAQQLNLEREVAIKLLLPELATDPDFIRSQETEAKLIAQVKHPFIVKVIDYWSDEIGAAIIMDYFNGGTLRSELRTKTRLPIERIAKILDQIGSALATAHRLGIVHRDLKPENILRDKDGNTYLSDFGLAQRQNIELTDSDFVGTFEYAPPEQLSGYPPAPTMDIYSMGMLLYEMLTGVNPMIGLQLHEMLRKQMHDPLPAVKELPGAEDRLGDINDIIQKATAKQPEDRFQNISDITERFRKALDLPDQHITTRRLSTTQVRAIMSDQPEEPEEVIGQHLEHLYRRIDELYDILATSKAEKTITDAKSRLKYLRQEIDYRNNGLETLKANEFFNPPLALAVPVADAHPLIGLEERLAALKALLLAEKSFALLGASGSGKSTIAAALARDLEIQDHFEGRVLWFQTGKTPDLFNLLGDWLLALAVSVEDLATLTTLEQRKKRLLTLVGTQSILVVADDVWKIEHLHNSIFDNRNRFTCVLTTVSAEIAADFLWDIVRINPLTFDQRLELLHAIVSDLKTDDPDVQRLVEVIGGYPRDLLLLGKRLKRTDLASSRLQREIDKIIRQPAAVLQQGYASLQLTIDELSEGAKQALWTLAQLPPEPSTCSEAAAEAICQDISYLDELVDFSLLRLVNGRYELNPGFAEYARQQLEPDTAALPRIVDYYFGYVASQHSNNQQISFEYRNIEAALNIALTLLEGR